MVKKTEEKVQQIIHNLKEAQARQNNYADKRGQPLVFQVNDHVYLKVSPMNDTDQWPTDSNYQKHCLQCIMCSMYLN
jgi:hypothetical protein